MAKELDPFKVLVGMRLQIVRSHLNFSKQQMADALKVKHSRYSRWEEGKNGLPIKFGHRLEAEFHVDSKWLYSPDRAKLKLQLVGRTA